jgi:hypothetical protein
VVNRELKVSQANKEAKTLLNTGYCRAYFMSECRNLYPARCAQFTIWPHFISEWPNIDELADRNVSYFSRKTAVKKFNDKHAWLSIEIREALTYWDNKKKGLLTDPVVDAANVPFLKVGPIQ